ncbi:MAG: hypothetical protein UD936_00190 [Acutalibacteraceae bacterium]|nr:hypothetical protein [Acutalibacteraceae bacterium]
MAIFQNQATLSFNGIVTNSNIATGEILEAVSVTKTAIVDRYTSNDDITYVISIVNSGATAVNNVVITDNLGVYLSNLGVALVPLEYIDGSVHLYVNGVQQAPPTAVGGTQLVISDISIPANGNAVVVYSARVNQFAPLDVDGTINNTAVVSATGITPIEATETISTLEQAQLTINKSVNPTTVTENGQLTYTFVIQNSGNTATTVTDDLIITDVFNPVLSGLNVTFNGAPWTEGVQYNYNPATGLFTTVAGQVTVPAATYTQNPDTNAWVINPGVSVLRVTGTV